MTRDFYAEHLERCLRRRDLPELKKRPVDKILLQLYIDRLKVYCAMHPFIRNQPIGLLLLSELEEWQGWVYKVGPRAWTDDDDNQVGNAFVNVGLSYENAKNVTRQVRDLNAKIRPHSKRAIAIRAKELKDADSSLTWRDVAEKVCDCQHQHTESCTARLKAAVSDLNKLLTKYQGEKP